MAESPAPGRAFVENLLALARAGGVEPVTLDAIGEVLGACGLVRCSASSLGRCRRGVGLPPAGTVEQFRRALHRIGGSAASESTVEDLHRLWVAAAAGPVEQTDRRRRASSRTVAETPAPVVNRPAAIAFIDDVLTRLLPDRVSARGLAERARIGNDRARAVVNGQRLLSPDAFARLLEHSDHLRDDRAVTRLVHRYLDDYARTLAVDPRWQSALMRLHRRHPRISRRNDADRTDEEDGRQHVEDMIAADASEHWRPSATGGQQSAPGPGFHGRADVLTSLEMWLLEPDDPRSRAVTGDPGSGKSAVVARTLLDITEAPRSAAWSGSVAAVHARGRTLGEICAILGHQLGHTTTRADQLLGLLESRTEPTLVVVDAVEESREVDDLITGLLRPLARRAPELGVHLLMGARRPVIPRIGARWVMPMDLDEDYPDPDGLADYVQDLLTATSASPYAGIPERTRRVAQAVANRAGRSFLIGRLVALALALRPQPATDLESFPDSVIGAMETYLDELPGDRRSIEELLRPLAYAEGAGLPRNLWIRLAGDLSGVPGKYDVAVHDTLVAGPVRALLAVSAESGLADRIVYRLFHDALAEAVADIAPRNPEAPAERGACEHAIARSLREAVPTSSGAPDWSAADPYIRTHLSSHAAGTPLFAQLITDPCFLLDADVDRLLAALAGLPSAANASRTAVVYELVADRLADATRPERAAYLTLSGLQDGTGRFADALHDLAHAAPWWPVSALWERRLVHRTVNRHADAVNAVAVSVVGGEHLVVSGGDDWQVRIRNVFTRTADEHTVDIGTPIMCLAAFFLDGLPAVVAGGEDGHLYVLDVPTLDLLARSSSAHTAPVSAVLPMMDGDETTFVSGDADGTLRRWTAVPCEPVGDPVAAGPGEITALCWTGGRLLRAGAPNRITIVDPDLRDLDELFTGPPSPAALVVVEAASGSLLVSGHTDGSLRIFDAASFAPIGQIPAVESGYLSAVVVSGPEVVCAGESGDLTVLDPARPDRPHSKIPGHSLPVHALAAAQVGARRIVLSGGEDATVRRWDLGEVGGDGSHPDDLRAVGVAHLDGQTVAIQSTEHSIALRTLPDWAPIGRSVEIDPPATLLTAFAVHGSPSEPLLAVGDDHGHVVVHGLLGFGGETGEVQTFELAGHDGWVSDLQFSELHGTASLVTIGHDNVLRLHPLENVDANHLRRMPDEASSPIPLTNLRGTASHLALTSIDGRPFAVVAGNKDQVQIWDLSEKQLFGEVKLPGIGTVSALAAHHDVVLGGTLTGQTFTFSLMRRDPTVHPTHATTVSTVAIRRTGNSPALVSGSEFGDIVVRHQDGGQLVSFALDATAHGLLVNDTGEITVATSRGVATVRLRQ